MPRSIGHPIAFALLLVLSGCYSARRHVEQARRLENEQQLQQAYDLFSSVIDRKPANTEAMVGRQRVAQGLFDRIQEEAGGAYLAGRYIDGETLQADAEQYRQHVAINGVVVTWDPLFEHHRAEGRSLWIDGLLQEARVAFANDHFTRADEITQQVLQEDAACSEAVYVQRMARAEPLYRDACRLMDMERYTAAFKLLEQVLAIDPNYKDAWTRREEVREKASYTLAYLPLRQKRTGFLSKIGGLSKLDVAFSAAAEEALLARRDPMVRLIDRSHTDALLAEQRKGLQPTYDEHTAAAAGQLLGARFVLTGEVLRSDDDRFEVRVNLIDASTGVMHVAKVIAVDRSEVFRHREVQPQFIKMAAQRLAASLDNFDPLAQ